MNNNILLQDLRTSFIYIFDKKTIEEFQIPHQRLGFSFLHEVEEKSLLQDMKSRDLFELPLNILQNHEVHDEFLGELLKKLEIFAIHKPHFGYEKKVLPVFSGMFTNPSWVSINLGGTCDNHCNFCYTEWTRNKQDFNNPLAIKILQTARKLSEVDSIVITGGEPTIRGDIEKIVDYARLLGFQRISLQTHGQKFSDQKKLDSLINAGMTDILLSFYGHNQFVYEKINGRKGSFKQIIPAIQNLAKSALPVTVNIVICQDNWRNVKSCVNFQAGFQPLQGQ